MLKDFRSIADIVAVAAVFTIVGCSSTTDSGKQAGCPATDSGYKEAVMLLRRRRVDAVICGNDVMAIGVRDAAERLLGLNVPKNLAIVGHDGISMGTWESHSITTVAFDRVAYFDAIVDFIEREDEAHGSNETVMPCHVRWGSST